jgi:hypothetical protein
MLRASKSCQEMEDALHEHPLVREAAVIGVSHPYRGERRSVPMCLWLILRRSWRPLILSATRRQKMRTAVFTTVRISNRKPCSLERESQIDAVGSGLLKHADNCGTQIAGKLQFLVVGQILRPSRNLDFRASDRLVDKRQSGVNVEA